MKRRQFIALLGGAAAAWPLAARAQQAAMPVVGFVSGMSSSASERQAAAFLKGLSEETGYLEGQNVAVEYHWLTGQYDQLPITYAGPRPPPRGFYSRAGSHPAALAAKAATTTIPIVFSVANDPVQLGLVVSLARARKRTSAPCYIGHKQSSARLGLAPIQRRVIP